jgi:protein-S-isoprenylcysteine O-methyltransferase Ste14
MRSDPPSAESRGAGWVFGQLALGGLVVLAGLTGPTWPSSIAGWAEPAGAVLTTAGAVLLLAGIGSLGRSLTPFPAPKDDA